MTVSAQSTNNNTVANIMHSNYYYPTFTNLTMKNIETLTGTTVTGSKNASLLFGHLNTAKRANIDNVTLRGTVTAG